MSNTSTQFRREGYALLHYVLGHPPKDDLVNRWEAGARAIGLSDAADLRGVFLRYPTLIRMIDPVFGTGSISAARLTAKLSVAAAIAEASPAGARILCEMTDQSVLASVARLCWLGIIELVVLPLRLFFTIGSSLWARK